MLLLWTLCAAVILLGLLFHLRFPYFLQDVQFVRGRMSMIRRMLQRMRDNYTVLDRFLDGVKAHPHKPFLLFRDDAFTYRDADELSTKAARVLLQSGKVKQGDTVAMFVGNEPAFLWLWLGLVKIGCSSAFLNVSIRSKSLLHCFNCSGATVLVAAAELQEAVEEILPSLLEQQVTVYILKDACTTAGIETFADKMKLASSEPLSKDFRSQLTLQSTATYIYTSGTTGFPKAAIISHVKLWGMSSLPRTAGANSNDVIYICLPLYHSNGFLSCIGAIDIGMTVALKTKFSASQFWDDCRKYEVTVIQYIGEVMRYLCNTPKKLNDRSHNVRIAFGNGLRADVWREFLRRFGEIKINEFYGATESNMAMINYIGKIGAVGRDSFITRICFKITVIKYSVERDEPERDASGFCIKAKKGECGLLVSEISMRTPFSGYARDLQQTEKKKMRDVFKKGDVYFNSGDLMRMDDEGFIYFHDRVGDTFRWKGENVATTEVADIITMTDCIEEANVYGVSVPGQEGRAGMAAVTLSDGRTFDSADVFKHVEKLLPSYARPQFIRIQNSIQVTATYKHMKAKLVEEGFDPTRTTDPLYFLDAKERNYVPLTSDIIQGVISGAIKM